MDNGQVLKTIKYGSLPDQAGDLYLPSTPHPPVICLLHGGFWRASYGRDQMDAIAADLARRGFAVWNLEYRRLGVPNAGWPGTFDDVLAGIDRLTGFAADGIDIDLHRVVVSGHSAGGHLALWAAARERGRNAGKSTQECRISAVVGQAPVADLQRAFELGTGGTAVRELLGGTPTERAERYRRASPRALLPMNVPQLLIHGTLDDVVPLEISRTYTEAAQAAGDRAELVELPGAGHMEFLDPASPAHAVLCNWLNRISLA
jgi:acetyl esterase/lipase